MRNVLFLSIVLIAVSGCASSGMYSMPTYSETSMQVQSAPVKCQRAHVKSSQKSHKNRQTKHVAKSQPKTRKSPTGNSAFLNDAIGASVKIVKNAYKHCKPKIAKIAGF